VGIIHITGNYYQDPFSEVNIDIGGRAPGTEYDRVEVTGEAYLDGGVLNLEPINGYQPGVCDQYLPFTYGSLSQNFDDIGSVSLTGDLRLRSVYAANGLQLLVSEGDTRIKLFPAELNLAEGGGAQSYKVCLGNRPESQVRLTVSPDAQLRAAPTELIFAQAAWNGVQTVTVNAVDDNLVEGPHNGFITHSASNNDNDFDLTSVSRVVAHIEDNEATPNLAVGDVSVTEGNSGTKQAVFSVRLSPASAQGVTVAYATTNGTATAGSDYLVKSGTLTFVAADTVETFGVTINGDLTAEANETFAVNLSSAINATIADAQGIGTITNDDGTAKVVADNLIGEGRFGVANYPNPFNPATQIVYTLTEMAPVRLVIYNLLGQQIRVLVEEFQAEGSYQVQWDGADQEGNPAGAGRYLYRLESGNQAAVGRMSLVK
jgi:hypothetical protein